MRESVPAVESVAPVPRVPPTVPTLRRGGEDLEDDRCPDCCPDGRDHQAGLIASWRSWSPALGMSWRLGPPCARAPSVGARQPEHVPADERLHEVVVDRRRLVEPRLAELALDVVLGGEAEAAVG